ncbi:MAG: aroD [Candidatus Taylorbacteria bacterium]|nr:aroD [Candidatus Taylorbacteria bacterium]
MNKLIFGITISLLPRTPQEVYEMLRQTGRAKSAEIRLDKVYDHAEMFADVWAEEIVKLSKPVILTFRTECHGTQWGFWKNLPKSLKKLVQDKASNVFVDFSIEFIEHWGEEIFQQLDIPPEKFGASLHNLHMVPHDLQNSLSRLKKSPAKAFLKFVPTARNHSDEKAIRNLLETWSDERPLIAFLMGTIGENSRLECLRWKSAATYCYPDGQQATAPGQLPLSRLIEHYGSKPTNEADLFCKCCGRSYVWNDQMMPGSRCMMLKNPGLPCEGILEYLLLMELAA